MLITGLTITGGAMALSASVYAKKQRKSRLVEVLKLEPLQPNPQQPDQSSLAKLLPANLFQKAINGYYQTNGTLPSQPAHETESQRTRSSIALISGGLILAGAVGGAIWFASAHGLTFLGLTNQLIAALQGSQYGPYLYILLYTIRPLILFPTVLMTAAGGLLFGPVWGIIYALAGAGGSALLAYGFGRFFGQKMLYSTGENGTVKQYTKLYTDWMKENPFESSLIMHLLLLHYDIVNALAGFLEADLKPFLAGTLLGSLPATVAFALFGSSIQGGAINALPHVNLPTVAAGGAIFVGSLALARYLKSAKQLPTAASQAS